LLQHSRVSQVVINAAQLNLAVDRASVSEGDDKNDDLVVVDLI